MYDVACEDNVHVRCVMYDVGQCTKCDAIMINFNNWLLTTKAHADS